MKKMNVTTVLSITENPTKDLNVFISLFKFIACCCCMCCCCMCC